MSTNSRVNALKLTQQACCKIAQNKACEFELAELTHLVNEHAEDERNAVMSELTAN